MYTETDLGGGCTLWRSSGSPGGVIPADGCVDVILRGDEVLLAGPSTRHITTTADLDGDAGPTTGVRFAPGVASGLLRLDLPEVRDAGLDLADVVGTRRAAAIRDAVLQQSRDPGVSTLVAALDGDEVLRAGRWRSVVVRAAVRQRGIAEVAAHLGWSERHTRRQVGAAFGYPYGSLVRVARARQGVRLVGDGVPLGEAAERAGYADQPHMTREFARLVGRTPGQVAGSAA